MQRCGSWLSQETSTGRFDGVPTQHDHSAQIYQGTGRPVRCLTTALPRCCLTSLSPAMQSRAGDYHSVLGSGQEMAVLRDRCRLVTGEAVPLFWTTLLNTLALGD